VISAVNTLGSTIIRPTAATRMALRVGLLIVLLSAVFLVSQYPSLPWLLPVRFRRDGLPIGWQYKTLARVLIPVFVQLALALTFGAVTLLLLSRKRGAYESDAPDVRAASAAAEAVAVISLIWVAFQAYAAVALVGMWTAERDGLPVAYTYVELGGLVITGIVAVRAHARLGRPDPRPFVAAHWCYGHLYRNAQDPALFVPARDGSRWTLNFGRPVAAMLLGLLLLLGFVSPTIILALALRS
jgi:uncharacterized membrane protein